MDALIEKFGRYRYGGDQVILHDVIWLKVAHSHRFHGRRPRQRLHDENYNGQRQRTLHNDKCWCRSGFGWPPPGGYDFACYAGSRKQQGRCARAGRLHRGACAHQYPSGALGTVGCGQGLLHGMPTLDQWAHWTKTPNETCRAGQTKAGTRLRQVPLRKVL